MLFSELGLSEPVLKAVEKCGYEHPTPIQEQAIPIILEGRDLIGASQTGTGKTAAFALPLLTKLQPIGKPQILVLEPTRELADQVAEAFAEYGEFTGLKVALLYGGVGYGKQTEDLKNGADIVVATPGRLVDHFYRGTMRFGEVKALVLDEVDRMLDMGFIHDVTRILDKIPSRRNLGMFSATISREVMDISWVYQRDPEEITVRADEQNKPDILQYAVTVEQTDKVAAMARIIRQEKLERVMVFCNTKGMVERLTKYLEMEGLDAACIHGDIPQKKREQVMARFRRGELPVFVATDVAARGIDVDDVDAVFNYDVPQENEYYVHRIGRTGRAKRHGVAYTLVADYPSKMRLDAIAKFTGNDVKPAHFEGDTLVVDAK